MPRPPGRPSKFTPELANAICARLARGESLRSICRDEGMPTDETVRQWALDDLHGFSVQYARARDLGLDAMADEVFEIADDGRNDWIKRENKRGETYIALNDEAVARSRLRFDARRWYLSKLAPKKYGERVTHEGDANNPLRVDHTGQVTLYMPDNGRAKERKA